MNRSEQLKVWNDALAKANVTAASYRRSATLAYENGNFPLADRLTRLAEMHDTEQAYLNSLIATSA